MVSNFSPRRSGIVINNYFNCKGGVKDCNCNVINISNRCNDCGYIHFNIQSNVDKMGYKDLKYILTKEINMISYVSKYLHREVRNEK